MNKKIWITITDYNDIAYYWDDGSTREGFPLSDETCACFGFGRRVVGLARKNKCENGRGALVRC